ncbi:MAG: aldolase [Armatimonadetes bacterium]|nr:aldolase [Armatimonadota bacterium]
MRKNTIKERLARGETVFGCFVNLPSPDLAEISGLVGFDFILIDCEHGPIDFTTMTHMVRAADAAGVPALLRSPQNVAQVILRYLDAGAVGIQVPQTNTRAEVEAAVRAVKYQPHGMRGLAAVRAAGYGVTQTVPEYVPEANRETMVIVQIESMEAVKNLPDLLTVPEVDVFFLGPTDLSHSMGLPGQVNHPDVLAVMAHCFAQIRAAGKVSGTIAIDSAHARRLMDQGVQYIVPGAGRLFVAACREFLGTVRAASQ